MAKLARACATPVTTNMIVATEGYEVDVAQREAFDRILQNHMLYCTVCDNNNQNCTVHEATKQLDVKHQARPYLRSRTRRIMSNPFYRYDPDQCILCGRCVEACQNVQVNETLTIDWESAHPRVLWDGGDEDRGLKLRSLRALRDGLPMQCADGEEHDRACGLPDQPPAPVLDDMIEVVKAIEPPIGYGPILALERDGSRDAQGAGEAYQDRLHLLWRGLHVRRVDARPAHPEDRAERWARQRHFHLRQGQVCVGLCQLRPTG